MLGSRAECHRSAASTELQHSDPRNGLLWVAAATLQLTAFLTSQRVFCQPRCEILTLVDWEVSFQDPDDRKNRCSNSVSLPARRRVRDGTSGLVVVVPNLAVCVTTREAKS